jgi:acetyl-CoA carboxylase biotin carboxyl carrier protein
MSLKGTGVTSSETPVEQIAQTASTAVPEPVEEEAPAAEAEVSGPTIDAPLNGTFYRSSAPGAPNLAEEGDVLKKGDPVFIVEAMKLFNQIKAPSKCKIVKFLVNHGDAVEKGQPLVVIEEK